MRRSLNRNPHVPFRDKDLRLCVLYYSVFKRFSLGYEALTPELAMLRTRVRVLPTECDSKGPKIELWMNWPKRHRTPNAKKPQLSISSFGTSGAYETRLVVFRKPSQLGGDDR